MKIIAETTSSSGGSAAIAPRIPMDNFIGPCDIGFLAKVDTGTTEAGVAFELILTDV